MMLGQLGDVTGQCAMGTNPNYDENGNFVSCTVGSNVQPNCVSGQQPITLADGSYGCSTGITEESVGVAAPDCGGGSPYLDGSGMWQCTAPPVQSSGSTGAFLVAAALALFAYFHFATKAGKVYKSAAAGDVGGMIS